MPDSSPIDPVEDWKRQHEELYGRLLPNPQLDLMEQDAIREREADYLIAESAALMEYYASKWMPKWHPGSDPWLH